MKAIKLSRLEQKKNKTILLKYLKSSNYSQILKTKQKKIDSLYKIKNISRFQKSHNYLFDGTEEDL